MADKMTKQRLQKYIPMRMEIDHQLERLARMKSNQHIPSLARESDGSQHTGCVADRMENAIIQRMNYEEKIAPVIEANLSEMAKIEVAIDELRDPMEREVLRLRYIDGEYSRNMAWNDIAIKIYGDNDEKQMMAVYRLHGRALQSIRGKTNKEIEK